MRVPEQWGTCNYREEGDTARQFHGQQFHRNTHQVQVSPWFTFSEQHIEEYSTLGYTVFRGIVPPKLINELRRECEKGAAAARERAGADTQRFSPVSKFPVDTKPFEEFENLPELHDAINRIMGMDWEPSGMNTLAVLLNPAEQAYCTHWHRDWRDNVMGLDMEAWKAKYRDKAFFNQVNCALYEDSCTWVVPGSHLREDTQAEVARFPARPVPGPQLEGLVGAEREAACLEYCYSMPGAQRLSLDAGDYCLYRNTLWHLGNYVPYCKRATLHENIMTPEYRKWFDTGFLIARERVEQGAGWENPNLHRIAA